MSNNEQDEDEDEDDWTDEIQKQNLETQETTTVAAAEATKVSPFQSEQKKHREAEADSASLPFTPSNVNSVLDEVRPYLVADGGDVSVSSVDPSTMSVELVLEGACGSCPSSTTTMKMGIERVLRETWEDLGEVRQVQPSFINMDGVPSKTTAGIIRKNVEGGLNLLTGAIRAMGGDVDLVDVDAEGNVKLRFKGSEKVKYGLDLAVRDVEGVKAVDFV